MYSSVGFLFNLMDNEKITYLSIDNKLVSAPNKVKRTNKNKTTKVEKKDIINFEEVAIRKSLFFRLYVAGTIEYGNVIISNYHIV